MVTVYFRLIIIVIISSLHCSFRSAHSSSTNFFGSTSLAALECLLCIVYGYRFAFNNNTHERAACEVNRFTCNFCAKHSDSIRWHGKSLSGRKLRARRPRISFHMYTQFTMLAVVSVAAIDGWILSSRFLISLCACVDGRLRARWSSPVSLIRFCIVFVSLAGGRLSFVLRFV